MKYDIGGRKGDPKHPHPDSVRPDGVCYKKPKDGHKAFCEGLGNGQLKIKTPQVKGNVREEQKGKESR